MKSSTRELHNIATCYVLQPQATQAVLVSLYIFPGTPAVDVVGGPLQIIPAETLCCALQYGTFRACNVRCSGGPACSNPATVGRGAWTERIMSLVGTIPHVEWGPYSCWNHFLVLNGFVYNKVYREYDDDIAPLHPAIDSASSLMDVAATVESWESHNRALGSAHPYVKGLDIWQSAVLDLRSAARIVTWYPEITHLCLRNGAPRDVQDYFMTAWGSQLTSVTFGNIAPETEQHDAFPDPNGIHFYNIPELTCWNVTPFNSASSTSMTLSCEVLRLCRVFPIMALSQICAKEVQLIRCHGVADENRVFRNLRATTTSPPAASSSGVERLVIYRTDRSFTRLPREDVPASLREIYILGSPQLSDVGRCLASLQLLKTVALEQCESLNVHDLRHVSWRDFYFLETLSFSGCVNLTVDALLVQDLGICQRLKYLNLSACHIEGDLPWPPQLQTILCNEAHFDFCGIFYISLDRCKHLTLVDFSHSNMEHCPELVVRAAAGDCLDGIRAASSCTLLLRGCCMLDFMKTPRKRRTKRLSGPSSSYIPLTVVAFLTHLDLSSTTIPALPLATGSPMATLRCLSAQRCANLSCVEPPFAAQFPALTHLSLAYNIALTSLQSLPGTLRYFDVSHCTALTAANILVASRSNLTHVDISYTRLPLSVLPRSVVAVEALAWCPPTLMSQLGGHDAMDLSLFMHLRSLNFSYPQSFGAWRLPHAPQVLSLRLRGATGRCMLPELENWISLLFLDICESTISSVTLPRGNCVHVVRENHQWMECNASVHTKDEAKGHISMDFGWGDHREALQFFVRSSHTSSVVKGTIPYAFPTSDLSAFTESIRTRPTGPSHPSGQMGTHEEGRDSSTHATSATSGSDYSSTSLSSDKFSLTDTSD